MSEISRSKSERFSGAAAQGYRPIGITQIRQSGYPPRGSGSDPLAGRRRLLSSGNPPRPLVAISAAVPPVKMQKKRCF